MTPWALDSGQRPGREGRGETHEGHGTRGSPRRPPPPERRGPTPDVPSPRWWPVGHTSCLPPGRSRSSGATASPHVGLRRLLAPPACFASWQCHQLPPRVLACPLRSHLKAGSCCPSRVWAWSLPAPGAQLPATDMPPAGSPERPKLPAIAPPRPEYMVEWPSAPKARPPALPSGCFRAAWHVLTSSLRATGEGRTSRLGLAEAHKRFLWALSVPWFQLPAVEGAVHSPSRTPGGRTAGWERGRSARDAARPRVTCVSPRPRGPSRPRARPPRWPHQQALPGHGWRRHCFCV